MSSKKYFDDVAEDWDEMRTGFFPVAVRERAIAEMEIRKGIDVADIGAGTGFITEGLVDLPINIWALDESQTMLDVMTEKFGNYSNVQYLAGESESLPVLDSIWHYALANMFLHHVERPSAVIKELYRTLKPGGKLIITDLDKHDHTFLVTEQNDRWMGFDRNNIISWYREAGFKEVKVDCVSANCCAESCGSDDKAEISIFIATGVK